MIDDDPEPTWRTRTLDELLKALRVDAADKVVCRTLWLHNPVRRSLNTWMAGAGEVPHHPGRFLIAISLNRPELRTLLEAGAIDDTIEGRVRRDLDKG